MFQGVYQKQIGRFVRYMVPPKYAVPNMLFGTPQGYYVSENLTLNREEWIMYGSERLWKVANVDLKHGEVFDTLLETCVDCGMPLLEGERGLWGERHVDKKMCIQKLRAEKTAT